MTLLLSVAFKPGQPGRVGAVQRRRDARESERRTQARYFILVLAQTPFGRPQCAVAEQETKGRRGRPRVQVRLVADLHAGERATQDRRGGPRLVDERRRDKMA